MTDDNDIHEELLRDHTRLTHLNNIVKAIRNVNQMIVHEDDPKRLIALACANLTETLGYFHAWITLLDTDGRKVIATAVSGCEDHSDEFSARIERGNFPICMRKALEEEGTIVTDHTQCGDCTSGMNLPEQSGLSRRLASGSRIYGILSVSVPAFFAHDTEELSLFDKLADDIAFALKKNEDNRLFHTQHQHMQFVIDGANMGTWEWNFHTGKISCNEICAQILGYTLEELTPLSIASWMELVHAGDRDVTRRQLYDCFTGVRPLFESEFRMKHKDGRWVWVMSRGRVMSRDAHGQPRMMFGTHIDITERKRTEALHREREEMMKLFIEHAPVALAMFDREMHYLAASRCWIEDYRLGNTEILGRSHYEVFPEIPDQLKAIHQQGMKGKIIKSTEDFFEREDGSFHWLYWEMRPWKHADGTIGGIVIFTRDITRQKLAEESLRKSEEKFRLIAENSVDCIWTMDKELNFTYISPSLERITGYTPEEWIGTPLHSHFREEEYFKIEALTKRAITHHKTFTNIIFQTKMLNNIDQEVDVEITGKVLLDTKGELVGLQGTTRDITDRIRSEEALRESEEKYRSLVDNANEAIVVAQDGFLKFMNHHFIELMNGYTEEELFSIPFSNFIHPDDREMIVSNYQRRLKGESLDTRYSFRGITHDGAVKWLEINAVNIQWKGKTATLNFLTDITERKHAEVELERLKAAIEQSSEIVVITDHDGIIQYINPAFEKISGYTRDEVIGKNPRILKSGEHDDEFYQVLWNTISSGKLWKGRFINKRKDGTFYTEEASISPVINDNGSIINYVGVKRDISEHLRLEEQYQQAQKMESVGRLAGGVAHDFNNMLNVIIGHTELVLNDLPEDSPLRGDLDEIMSAAERSANLTRQLLAFARRQTVTPQALDLNETIKSMLKMLERLIGEDIHLLWKPAAKLGLVHIDPAQVDQILANLVVNSRDAIGKKTGKITIETAQSFFDDDYCAAHTGFLPGEYIILAVSDDGQGMDEKVKAQVFEPFFTTKSYGKGTGLGLSTVYGIVKQNYGFINIYSEPDHGTTIRIFLPVYTGVEKKESKGTVLSVKTPQGHETILLVEDEPAILELGKKILERYGYLVLPASTPEEAIKIAEHHPDEIHLLITDVVMPEMNGRDLAKRILSMHPNLKRLFMSGYTANVIAHHGVLDEGVNFIQKPFSINNFAIKVRDALEK